MLPTMRPYLVWASRCLGLARAWLLFAPSLACTESAEPRRTQQALIYGEDDRREYFELDSPELRVRMERSIVAIVPLSRLDEGGRVMARGSLGDLAVLCDGEPHAEQPAAALCTGVLVDWDIVLTAGHCLRALSPDRLAAVFDYYYAAEGELQPGQDAVFPVQEIVAEALSSEADGERLDYGFLRLVHAAAPPREPIPIRIDAPMRGDALTAVTAPGGIPLKADGGGRIADARETTLDYFIADTDTSGGSSGGPALDQRMRLLGILARGGPDYVPTDSGCQVVARVGADRAPEEHYTYASRALDGLCRDDPGASSLCRPDCGDPCTALPPQPAVSSSCSIREGRSRASVLPIALVLLLLAMHRRKRL